MSCAKRRSDARCFLDSSALIKLVVEVPGSWALSEYLAGRDRCSSDLSR
jgi:hypothetical protein